MNPSNHPAPPYSARSYTTTSVSPNAFYGMHINASLPGSNISSGPGVNGSGPSRIPAISSSRANSSPTSFYPPHLAQISQVSPLAPTRPTLGGVPPVPQSLMPGGGARNQRVSNSNHTFESALFFQTSGSLTSPSILPTSLSQHVYAQQASVPNYTRPVLPPKPQIQAPLSGIASITERGPPKLPPKDFTVHDSVPQSAITASAGSHRPEKDVLVTRVLELSLKDSGPVKQREEEEEDEVLARVLAESMASFRESNGQDSAFAAEKRSSSPECIESGTGTMKEPLSALSASSSSPSILSSFSATRSDCAETQTPATSSCSHTDDSYSSSNPCATVAETVDVGGLNKEMQRILLEEEGRRRQLEADEEFARSIARSEASSMATTQLQIPSQESRLSIASAPPSMPSALPPVYDDVIRNDRPLTVHTYTPQSNRTLPEPNQSSPNRPMSPGQSTLGRSSASYSAGSGYSQNTSMDRLGRSSSAQATMPGAGSYAAPPHRPSLATHNSLPVPNTQQSFATPSGSPSTPKTRPRLAVEVSPGQRSESDPGPSRTSNNGYLTTNEDQDSMLSPISPASASERDKGSLVTTGSPSSAPLIEEELLFGVSIGFNSPSMMRNLEIMKNPIPNIITLPTGKCLPLHIQAPNWKQLLKLLTRLSESRIEPTVEALASTKTDIKLRTVVQFMKVHHTSNEWRTIIYLTIDTSVPSTVPNSHKYTNGDVNTLPYSYTISPVPPLLRGGGGDSNLSRCFTVPATPNIPYPTLPLSLPDFAMYLHAVLENSRRASNDSSGGLRKLAKMVDSFYPNTSNAVEGLGPESDGPDRRSVGGFFRRALGRGDRNNRNQGGDFNRL